ncbi:uncharacterized protein LOC143037050 [Oratosquilla oratoria]|uniref:uncharacterized protein LOC143037050 n=1 Tax=Oratosquilla oratoria TaxID=337810 RepID=UPI003F762EBE
MLASGSELLSNRGREHLLPVQGEKLQEPNFTCLEDECLKAKLDEQMHMLQEPRTTRSDQLAHGEYLKVRGMVHVKKECGKFWQYMGVDTDIGKCLYPEEALYLMESGVMEVEDEGIPMSVQQAFSSLLRDDHHIDQYLVFAFFSRLGCKIVKHQPHLCTTRYEKKIRLDQHQIHLKSKKFNLIEVNNGNDGNETVESEDILADELLSFYKSISSGKEVEIQELHSSDFKQGSKEHHPENMFMSHFQVMKKEILDSFPSFHETKCLQIRTPPMALLPPNAVPSREVYEIDVERLYWDDSIDYMDNFSYSQADRWRDDGRHPAQWQEQSSSYENWKGNNVNNDWQRNSNCAGWQGKSRNSQEGWHRNSHDHWSGNDFSDRWQQNEKADNWKRVVTGKTGEEIGTQKNMGTQTVGTGGATKENKALIVGTKIAIRTLVGDTRTMNT